MIFVTDGINKHKFSGVIDEMFKLRARVFRDRMGWDVSVRNGRETDAFDELDPAYVICLNDDHQVVGCARLLQTTGPHMLSDVFYDILDGEPPLRSARIWESTRFCIDRDMLGRGKERNSVSYATCELMIGILEYARDAGISDIITVIDPVMDRVLKRSDNAPYDYVGKTVNMGKVSALAALLDCTDERIGKLRGFADIREDVFVSEEKLVKALAQSKETEMHDYLKSYCDEQISSATSAREKAAAHALKEALARMVHSAPNEEPVTTE